MFSKIHSTVFRPEKPVLIWDGECPFCRYWVIRLQKITGRKVAYVPYQSIHSAIPDIPESAFREAVRLIDTRGNVFNGPETAYWCLKTSKRWHALMEAYRKSKAFRSLSDALYYFVSNHRPFMLKITKFFLGADPYHTKPYWLVYLAVVAGALAFTAVA